MERPSGTVTFLFTDVEGSTKRWEAGRAEMRQALGLHDRVMREAIVKHHGYVFKTVGDAFCAAFETAPDAAAAALNAQRALRHEDFSAVGGMHVRMALHTGTAQERDVDYFGPAVNRVARLLAIGHGGQVLVSRTTADLLQSEMPEGSGLRDLGPHRLKDLTLPEQVYQFVGAGLQETFPQLRALGQFPNNLPSQLTSFVGRDDDVAAIKQIVKEHRLTTLVGAGGAGKTRCALQIGAELLEEFSDGVWLAEFAPLSDASLVPGAIAGALGVRESPDGTPLDALLSHLERRQMLLVFDNCEHVIAEVRNVAAAILRSCPGVRVLATSLESLNIAGERVFRLPSLAVPPNDARGSAEAAQQYGAVALFSDRALASDGRFTLTNDNAPFVTEICKRLDGIPLAIELAAARIKVLSPRQLAQRLDERFRVLTGGDRSALARHQTMRALIDWSYDLLSEPERALFRKLSIFVDGFTLEGATAVCGDEACDEIAVLDMLSSLVDKSLVQTGPTGEDRYRLLESTRQYAREKLIEEGEFDASARRHLGYLGRLFARAGAEYEAAGGLVAELEDARSALDWGEQHAPGEAADLFLASRLWIHLGLNREGMERARRLIALTADNDAVRLARLWNRVAIAANRIGHNAIAKDASERALRYARAQSDPETLGDCLLTYADAIAHVRRFEEAEAALTESEKCGTPTPRRKLQAVHVRGLIASIQGDQETAARCFADVLELYTSMGNDAGVVSATINLAEHEHARGATRQAVEIATKAIPNAERLPNRGDFAFLMRNLAGYLGAAGDVAGACQAASKAISYYAAQDPAGPFFAIALEHFALCLAIGGDLRTAALLEGYVERTLTQLGFEREYTEITSHRRLMELLQQKVAAGELADLLARGERMQPNEAAAIANAVPFTATGS